MVEPVRGYGPPVRAAAARGSAREGFRLPGRDDAAAAASVVAAGALGLPSLQEVPASASERDAMAARRGQALLKELAALQHGLLRGRLELAQLRRLAALSEGEPGADPALREIMDGLALRARVELARLGQ